MAFWSGEKIRERMGDIVSPPNEKKIDCSSYTLTIGKEVYVSPNYQVSNPQSQTKKILTNGEAFTIPPGQFSFLVTHEIVTMPYDAMAFISMKTKFKFRGLINISGFHVDPGYSGKLIFSVFNAGPAPVHLHQGQDLFLIWFADLDRSTEYKKNGEGQIGLPVDIINSIPGTVHSLAEIDDRLSSVQRDLKGYKVLRNLMYLVLVGIAINYIWGVIEP